MLKKIGDVVLPKRVRTRFEAAGIFTLDDLLDRTASDILRMPQLGRGSYNVIKHALGKSGLTLKGDTLDQQPIDKAISDKLLAEAAVVSLKAEIHELQFELKRNKKLLVQAMERDLNPVPVLDPLSQKHLDKACQEAFEFANSKYKRLLGRLYWIKDRSAS